MSHIIHPLSQNIHEVRLIQAIGQNNDRLNLFFDCIVERPSILEMIDIKLLQVSLLQKWGYRALSGRGHKIV